MVEDEFTEQLSDDEPLPKKSRLRDGISNSRKTVPEKLTISDFDSLYVWIHFIAHGGELHIDSPKVVINIFGSGDDSYLVIERYTNKTSSEQYYFETEDRRNPLKSLLHWLENFDYSMSKLLQFIQDVHYYETEMGPEVRHMGMIISRSLQGEVS